jgi:hypothetical protein
MLQLKNKPDKDYHGMHLGSTNTLNRVQLTKIKFKAMRAGVWFKALPRIDRALFDLTIKVAENIRSATLAKGICSILAKLESHLESNFIKFIRLIGHPRAERLSATAQKWGNASAKNWVADSSFEVFLAVMYINR